MKVASIMENDIVDSTTGVNVSVWFAGCPHKCKGCHNPELWDETAFEDIPDNEVIDKVLKLMKGPPEKGLSILGGEPLSIENREDVLLLVTAVREKFPKAQIYIWTGFIFESIKDDPTIKKLIKKINFLIDGPFIEEKKGAYKLRGSSNQRILGFRQ